MVGLTPFWRSVETGLHQGIQTQHRVKGALQRDTKHSNWFLSVMEIGERSYINKMRSAVLLKQY